MSRSARTAVQSGPGVIDTVARAGLHAVLRAIRSGRLVLHETWSGRSFAFGPANAELDGELVVHDPSFYRRIARDRSIGFGEAYADGSLGLTGPRRRAANPCA